MTLHSAPAVSYPLGRSRALAYLLFAAWLVAALVTALWWQAARQLDWRLVLGLTSLVGAGWALYAGWRDAPIGQLVWDGQLWRWESRSYQGGAALQAPTVMLDLQRVMLLRLQNQARASWWLWAQRSSAPARWLDLRRAVYSRRQAHDLFLPDVMPALQDKAPTKADLPSPRPTSTHP